MTLRKTLYFTAAAFVAYLSTPIVWAAGDQALEVISDQISEIESTDEAFSAIVALANWTHLYCVNGVECTHGQFRQTEKQRRALLSWFTLANRGLKPEKLSDVEKFKRIEKLFSDLSSKNIKQILDQISSEIQFERLAKVQSATLSIEKPEHVPRALAELIAWLELNQCDSKDCIEAFSSITLSPLRGQLSTLMMRSSELNRKAMEDILFLLKPENLSVGFSEGYLTQQLRIAYEKASTLENDPEPRAPKSTVLTAQNVLYSEGKVRANTIGKSRSGVNFSRGQNQNSQKQVIHTQAISGLTRKTTPPTSTKVLVPVARILTLNEIQSYFTGRIAIQSKMMTPLAKFLPRLQVRTVPIFRLRANFSPNKTRGPVALVQSSKDLPLSSFERFLLALKQGFKKALTALKLS